MLPEETAGCRGPMTIRTDEGGDWAVTCKALTWLLGPSSTSHGSRQWALEGQPPLPRPSNRCFDLSEVSSNRFLHHDRSSSLQLTTRLPTISISSKGDCESGVTADIIRLPHFAIRWPLSASGKDELPTVVRFVTIIWFSVWKDNMNERFYLHIITSTVLIFYK